MSKPDLDGKGLSHPARFSKKLMPIFEEYLDGYFWVLDPFAGTGRIHDVPGEHHTIGIEIEPEWAELHPSTIVGDATDLPMVWTDRFDAICTSPCYGNRLADHHNASDGSLRRSYTHDLGRKLHPNNAGGMHWGPEYRELHEKAWNECARVLKPGGRFILNIKDHIRGGIRQPVTSWHLGVLVDLGLRLFAVQVVDTPQLKQGENSHLRCPEGVYIFDVVDDETKMLDGLNR
jgi:SAM-dependent methyltransferase